MTKLFYILFISLFIFSGISEIQATHVMGGEITWTCVGQDSFIIDLTIYRDCNGNTLGSPTIPIKCSTSGATITSLTISTSSVIDITPMCGTNCNRCQSSSCTYPYGIEQYKYTKLAVLSSAGSCCKVTLSYSMCCRNTSITTGAANLDYYLDASLDRCVSPCDNSPSFTNPPMVVLCIGQDFQFNHGLVDNDTNSNGVPIDSLSYEWTPPLSAAGVQISYTGQYSYDKPLYFWGFPNSNYPFPRGFHLDPFTGDISFRSMKIEQTIMAIKISEWRDINGTMTLIGHTRRDLQIIVMSCPNNNAPKLSGPYYKEVCAGDTVMFSFSATDKDKYDSIKLKWNNSIPNAIWITNNDSVMKPYAIIKIPTDTSKISSTPYVFTVTARDNGCPANASSTRAYQFLVKKADTSSSNLSFSKQYLGCGSYLFSVNNPDSLKTYSWYFYDKDVTATNGSTATFNYFYPNSYPLVLVSSGGCPKTITSEVVLNNSFIHVDLKDSAHIVPSGSTVLYPDINVAPGTYSFMWQDGNTTNLNRTFYYNSTLNTQKVILTVTDTGGCTSKDSCILYYGYVHVNAGSDIVKCDSITNSYLYGRITFLHGSSTVTNYNWYLQGDTTPISNSKSLYVSKAGNYVFSVKLSNGYIASDTLTVSVLSKPTIVLGADTTVCSDAGLLPLYASPYSPSSYWSGSYLTIIDSQYYFTPKDSGFTDTFSLQYNYVENNGCTTTANREIIVLKKIAKPEIGTFNTMCVNSTAYQFNQSLFPGIFSGNGIVNDRSFDPQLAGIGTHEIVYKIGPDLCPEYDTTFITVVDLPHPNLTTVNGKTKFCRNYGDVELSGTPVGGTYQGFKINGNTINTYDQPDSFNVSYFYSDSNTCTNTDTLFISLIDTPDFYFTANKLIVHQSDTTPILFQMKANANPTSFASYEWDFGDGDTSHATNPLHLYKTLGLYTVSLTIINKDGCIGTVINENYISVLVGLQEDSQNTIEIKPNPANTETRITSTKHIKEITVYNSLGKLIVQEKPKLNEYILHRPGSGIYYIRLTDIDDQTYFRKVVFN